MDRKDVLIVRPGVSAGLGWGWGGFYSRVLTKMGPISECLTNVAQTLNKFGGFDEVK